jgi:hypothetical protein
MAEQQDYATFLEEPMNYDRCIVAFYDVLGWRNKIDAAGDSVVAITDLKNIVRLFNATHDAYRSKNPFSVRQTTFSDNVVVSTEASRDSIFTLILRLGMTQLVVAQTGHFIRGGVTLGNLAHDDYVVFGPALNRAYDLERNIAKYPRIIVDAECSELFDGLENLGNLIAYENGVHFIDPWTAQFAGFFSTIPAGQGMRPMPPNDLHAIVLYRVLEDLKTAKEHAAPKFIWLRDRLMRLFLVQQA